MIHARKHRLVLAEDHTILRDGLRSILESRTGYEIVGEAGDGREAIRLAAELEPDLVILDLSMPRTNGLEALREIKRVREQTRVLILTAHTTEDWVFEAIKSGANGYLLKDGSATELLEAVASLLRGERYLSPGIATTVVAAFLRLQQPAPRRTPYEDLTQREREVLKLVAEGYRTRDIAAYLCISPKTVEKHRGSLMKRLKIHNVSALTAFAIEKGLVSAARPLPGPGEGTG